MPYLEETLPGRFQEVMSDSDRVFIGIQQVHNHRLESGLGVWDRAAGVQLASSFNS